MIVCFELPCPARESFSTTSSDTAPTRKLILPVHLCKERSRNSLTRSQHNFAPPFIIVLDDELASSSDAIYAAIIERLERWTQNARDLHQWEMEATDASALQGPIPIAEITETGNVTLVDEPIPEEGDIVDERAVVISDEGIGELNPVLRRIGPKPGLFTINVQPDNHRYGTSAAFNTRRWESLDARSDNVGEGEETSALLHDGDALFCDWDDNFRSYFFGEDDRFELSRWTERSWNEFIHPEFRDASEASVGHAKKSINLQDCLAEFTKPERLGEEDLWYCPRCKKHQQATKRFEIWTIPDFLVVHLKRFSNSRILRDKIDAFVDFPIEGLDLEQYCGEREVTKRLQQQDAKITGLSDTSEPLIYDLYAVDEHLGGLGGGHYRAYAKLDETGQWYHFDDSYVSKAEPSDAVVSLAYFLHTVLSLISIKQNANAYLLFYRRRSSYPLGGKTHETVEAAKRMEEETSVGSQAAPSSRTLDGTPAAARTALSPYHEDREVSRDGWRSMTSTARVSLSPSPSAVDESNSEIFSDSEAEARPPGIGGYDQLSEDIDNFPGPSLDFFDTSSLGNSPASSNAAEAGDDIDDTDAPLTP